MKNGLTTLVQLRPPRRVDKTRPHVQVWFIYVGAAVSISTCSTSFPFYSVHSTLVHMTILFVDCDSIVAPSVGGFLLTAYSSLRSTAWLTFKFYRQRDGGWKIELQLLAIKLHTVVIRFQTSLAWRHSVRNNIPQPGPASSHYTASNCWKYPL